MSSAVHLETSFTFVTPSALKHGQKPQINELTFASNSEHFVLGDDPISKSIHEVAMQEMALTKIPVGSPNNFEQVEFFWIDLKKGKKSVDRIKKVLTLHWLRLIYRFEQARENSNGETFTVNTNEAAAGVETFIQLRRFLVEGLDPENLRKKKRSILLFHDTETNAPRPE